MSDGAEDTRPTGSSPQMASEPRARKRFMRIFRACAVILLGLTAFWMFDRGTDDELRPAETNWITTGNNYFQKLFVEGQREASDWAVAPIPQPDSPWGNAGPPLAKYLYGGMLELTGHSAPHLQAFYDFDKTPEANEALGNVTPPERLKAARAVSLWLGVLTCLILFLWVRSIWGHWTGLAAGFLLALSPVAGRWFSMVDDTAPFLFAVSLASWAAVWVHRRLRRDANWLRLLAAAVVFGVLCGLTAGVRLAGAFSPLLLILPLSYRLKQVGWSGAPRVAGVLTAILVMAMGTFLLPAPYLHDATLTRINGMIESQDGFLYVAVQASPDKALDSLPERVLAMLDAVLFLGDPFFARARIPLGAIFLLIGLWVITRRLVAHREGREADAIVPLSLFSVIAAATLALIRLDREMGFLPLIFSAIPLTAAGMRHGLEIMIQLVRGTERRTHGPVPAPPAPPVATGGPTASAATAPLTFAEAMATARLPRHFLDGPIKYPFFAGLIAIFIFAAVNLHGSLSGSRRFQYNVVLISIDGLRVDHLGCYGQERNLTPNIDTLSRRGIVYERAFAQTTSAGSAFATLVTGLPPIAHGFWPDSDEPAMLPLNSATLAEVLQERGYQTRSISSRTELAEQGFDQGFVALDHTVLGDPAEPGWQTARSRESGVTAEAIRWLREQRRRFRTGEERFYLRLHYTAPSRVTEHPRWQEPAALAALEDLRAQDDVDITAIDDAFLSRIQDPRAWYAQAVRVVDFEVRRVLELLENCKLDENTLVVVTGTQGQWLPSAGVAGDHPDPLELTAVHVPLLVYCPGDFVLARHLQTVARQMDILPTILDYLGVEPPQPLPGRSLRQGDPEQVIALVVDPLQRTRLKGIDGKLALTLDLGEPEQSRLYDLMLDPEERVDILTEDRIDEERLRRLILRELKRHLAAARDVDPSHVADYFELAPKLLDD